MDDLSALDWSTSSSTGPNSTAQRGKSAFDYLASTVTVSVSPTPRPITPQSASTTAATSPASTPSGQDAFGSLFSDLMPSKPRSDNLTMAQRMSRSSSPLLPAKAPASQPASSNSSVWDFDLLSAPPSSTSASSSELKLNDSLGDAFSFDVPPTTRTQTSVLSAPTHDDSFGLAFDHVPASKAQTSTPDVDVGRIHLGTAGSGSRPASPPPHVLGQLVEMGFGIQQARSALLKTYASSQGQWNVQAAAEEILSSEMASSPVATREEEYETRRPSPILLSPRPHKEQPSRRNSPNPLPASKEELVAQASEIGLSVFKTANSYWRSSKKAVQKAYVEQIAPGIRDLREAHGASFKNKGEAGEQDGRPKWMRDLPPEAQQELEQDVSRPPAPMSTSQRLLFDDDLSGPVSVDTHQNQRQQRRQPLSVKERLAAVPEPQIYKSSARRQVPSRMTTPSPSPSSTQPPPKPKPSYVRPPAHVSPAALQQATKLKSEGNERFKLGHYGDAESSYSSALKLLPSHHLERVLILNNRANARLKNGSEKGAIEDTSEVFVILFGTSTVSLLDASAAELVDDVYNLPEAAGKALGRRAQGFEAIEKWAEAEKDWQVLLRSGGVFVKSAGGPAVVSAGLERTRKALAPKAKPKPSQPRPSRPTMTNSGRSSEAVKALRETAESAEAEENLKLSLKDAVDAKIEAWKGGKENNIRALVASLDAVLWPEFGWKKVGMHEVITENQLKIRYMKAIARLHPDKLDVNKTTVEQRMIANSVFSALNDAWNAPR